MNIHSDDDVKGIVEEMAQDRGRGVHRASGLSRNSGPSSPRGRARALLFGGVALAVLVAVLVLLLGRGDPEGDEAWRRLSERVARMESTLERLEASNQQFPALIGRIEGLGKSVSRLESEQRTLLDRADRLARRVDALADAVRTSGGETEDRPREAAAVQAPSTHTVQRGETLFRIARRYGLSVEELCRLNGINRNAVIRPGQELVVGSGG